MVGRRRALLAVVPTVLACGVASAIAGESGAVRGRTLSGAPRCPVLPPDNPWNQRVDRLPVTADSARLVASIGFAAPVHADFGSGLYQGAPIGIPYAIASRHTRRVPVSFIYASESDGRLYPLAPRVPIEGGAGSSGDRHVIVVDRDSCRDYELFAARPRHVGTSWSAGSGAIFDLRSDRLRPKSWTSADAAGLPILPGLARYDELRSGMISHALRFTAARTRTAYVYPARHQAGSSSDPGLPPMGLRLRLKASVDLAGLSPQARVVAVALKRYGLMLADNGSPWYISGAPDRHWSNDDLHTLSRLTGRDFEVVNTSSLPHPGS